MNTFENIIPSIYGEYIEKQLRDGAAFFGNMLPELTEEQKAVRKAAMEHYRERANVATRQYLLIDDPIAKLHSPDDTSDIIRFCGGCDSGLYAEEAATWPCRTALLIMEQNHIEWPQ